MLGKLRGRQESIRMNLIENKKARLNYEFLEEFEAGIELFGFEVKALRSRRGNLEGARVLVRGGEAFLVGVTIPPYQAKNTPQSYDEVRPRRLLLTKKEIGELSGYEHQKGLTIIPVSVYNKGHKLKLRLAVVRGKKKYDKRQVLKSRDDKRAMERSLKTQY